MLLQQLMAQLPTDHGGLSRSDELIKLMLMDLGFMVVLLVRPVSTVILLLHKLTLPILKPIMSADTELKLMVIMFL